MSPKKTTVTKSASNGYQPVKTDVSKYGYQPIKSGKTSSTPPPKKP